jgi:hypothetical protein
MTPEEFVRFSVIFALIVFPALGLTARFALKPFVDALLRLKEGGLIQASDPALLSEVRQLREEMAHMEDRMALLQDAESFHRRLAEPGAAPPPASTP